MPNSSPPNLNELRGVRALVTGGAGLVGSHIVDRLAEAGAAEITVIDDLSRGRRASLTQASATGRVSLVEGDILDQALLARACKGVDILFHMAAIRLTQCAEQPRLALQVMGEGTFNVLEASVRCWD